MIVEILLANTLNTTLFVLLIASFLIIFVLSTKYIKCEEIIADLQNQADTARKGFYHSALVAQELVDLIDLAPISKKDLRILAVMNDKIEALDKIKDLQ